MTTVQIPVHFEEQDIIGRMERMMEIVLGYKLSVYDALCYPKDKDEISAQKWCERVLHIRAMTRIKARRALSLSSKQKLLCAQK